MILSLLLTACASEGKYHATLDTWLGSTEDELVESWGTPDSFYEKDGERFLQYKWEALVTLPGYSGQGYSNPSTTLKAWCKTIFIVSKEEGKIKAWRTQGNDCTSK